MMIVTKLSANWFPRKERVISTMFGSSSIVLGCSAGFFFPYFFIDSSKNEHRMKLSDIEKEQFKLQIENMLVNMATISTVLLMFVIVLFHNEPSQPSYS